MRAADQYHVGLVVDDPEAERRQLSELLGYSWADVITATVEVWLPAGARDVTFSFAYSRTTPRLEVVQAVPGTPWEPVAGSGIHHLGFWSDDFDGDVADLERRGYAREAAAVGPDGRPMFAFYRGATGPRIELVPTASRPFLEQLWS